MAAFPRSSSFRASAWLGALLFLNLPLAPLTWAQNTSPEQSVEDDANWNCEPGDRVLEQEGDGHDRRIDKWLCRRRRPVRFLVGLSQRGVLSESGTFADKLGFEAGLRFFSRADLALGIGQVFKDGAGLSLDVHGRFFLFDFPGTGGPYLGGGWRFKETKRTFVTFGFFGGGGLFFELQFRGSAKQPLAVVPAFGLRYAFP